MAVSLIPFPGMEIILQIIDGGGDGLDYYGGGGHIYFPPSGYYQPAGYDIIIGMISSTVTATPESDLSDFGLTLSGTIGGHGTVWSSDTWVRIGGVEYGDWVWESPISLTDGDYSDPKTLPENVAVDNGIGDFADGSNVAIPEPSTLGLLGIAGFGPFMARRNNRR